MVPYKNDPFFAASYFDGKTAIRRKVEIQTIGRTFFLVEQERRHGPYRFEYLTFVSKTDNKVVYGYEDIDGWRLKISGHIPQDLATLLPAPQIYGKWIDKLGVGKASLAFIIASTAIVAVGMTAPQWLAPLIPQALENKLGEALVGDFGGRICHTSDGKAALQKLTNSLDSNPDNMQVEVINIGILNAIALPGGKVFLFDGLLEQASSVDEVAGVLGHEIGHVRERHVMQGLLRQLGLSVILGGFNDDVSGLVGGLLSNSYGRDAEREADAHSIKVMAQANISPADTKLFFEKLSSLQGKDNDAKNDYNSSHPLSKDRAAEFQKSYDPDKEYQPALTKAEWSALQSMCKNDPDVKSGFGFDLLEE